MFRRQDGSRRCILAVPFFAFGDVELEAVRSWQLPRRAGHRNTHFLIGFQTSRFTFEAWKSVEPIVSNEVFSESGMFFHRSPWYSTPAANETGPAGRLNRSPSRW